MASVNPTKPYKYLDTPDGYDVDKKLWSVLKPTIPLAGLAGLSDVLLVSHPKGVYNSAVRFAGVTLPIVGVASTFVLVTNGLASFREKDDHLNWFVGGFAAGSLIGAVTKNKFLGFNMGMAFGIFGLIRKEMAIHGWTITNPNYHIKQTNIGTNVLLDFSITDERPGNWTTGK
ncbi:hypothetical protein ABEB36_007168 [Hypothenemus hampei]|uniref:NADH dehydrogenase [ubiquinone] 1 alpha subcomplex subunit 11 n=1 Tax=Hypothenemus hampei TaxID=57062 RepID=A0ABD1ETZ2_HYPHA